MISFVFGLSFGGLNIYLLARIVRGFIQAETVSTGKTVSLFLIKIILIFTTLGLLLWKQVVSPVPFLAGYTFSLVVGILYIDFKN